MRTRMHQARAARRPPRRSVDHTRMRDARERAWLDATRYRVQS